jgi:hypothetical protein
MINLNDYKDHTGNHSPPLSLDVVSKQLIQ